MSNPPGTPGQGAHWPDAPRAIMGRSIGRYEKAEADIVIRPVTAELPATDFAGRHRAVLEGEKAAAAAMADIKEKLARLRARPCHFQFASVESTRSTTATIFFMPESHPRE